MKLKVNCYKMNSFVMLSLLTLMVPATVLYLMAMFTAQWFTLPSTSYGIWWVRYCDKLYSCQLIPALFNDQPVWYLLIQTLSILSCVSLILSIILLTTKCLDKYILPYLTRLPAVGSLLFLSVFLIVVLMITFYTKLSEPSTHELPRLSSSTYLAISSCILQFIAALGLFIIDMNTPPNKSVCSILVCNKAIKCC